ncbi:tyrosine-type recombinase/integrase [Devosia sp. CAU 1758]
MPLGNSSATGGQALGAPTCSHDWQLALQELEGAYAATTISGYTSDFALFVDWCHEKRYCPLPCSDRTLACYLDEMILTLKATTLVRRLAAVVRVHRVLNLENPAESERVRLARRRVQRYRPSRPRQAHGIDRDLRAQMLAACTDSLAGKRDKVLVALGFEGLCRRSEIAVLDHTDLVTDRRGNPAILIRRGKGDQLGEGRVITLSSETAAIVDDWIGAAEITNGSLVRPVYRGRTIDRSMAGFSISRLLKSIAARAGLPPGTVAEISGHSLRVGAAQTLLQDGHDVLRLMRAGGWKSAATVSRYVERAEVDVWT